MDGEDWNVGKTQIATKFSSSLIQGFGEKRAKDFEARQLKRNAKAISAKGNREAIEVRRQGKIMASNARASMAGSGGVTTDSQAVEQLSSIKQRTDYNAVTALFEANTQADALRTEASAKKIEGQRAVTSGVVKSLSTVLKNSDKIFGKKPPKKTDEEDKRRVRNRKDWLEWLAVRFPNKRRAQNRKKRAYNQKRGY